ncbi:MAG: hypothetical protein U1E85_03590 [Rhodocyclaceae bacterium]
MKAPRLIAALMAITSGAAFAQSAGNEFVQRNVNQQQRIEQGLQSGQLTTREAARLEKGESRVENMEARALRDGQVTRNEARHIDQAQDRLSRDIYREKHDAQVGNPNSPSSQRMQADVARNINQQQRIAQGVRSGQLTPGEAGRMQHREATINRMQGRAGADGHVGRNEQRGIQHAQNHQSEAVWRQKHDRQEGGWNRRGENGNHYGNSGNHGRHAGWGQGNNHRGPQAAGHMQVARR